MRINIVHSQILFDFRNIVIWFGHRDNSTTSYKYRKFPKRRFEIINDTSACITLSGKVVNPFSIGQVNTIANIISRFVCFGFFKYWSNQKIRSIHKLVLSGRSMRIFVWILQKHRSNHRHTVNTCTSYAISVRHNLRF